MYVTFATRLFAAFILLMGVSEARAQSQADLTVALSGPSGAVFGDQVRYSLTVENSGSSDATNVTIALSLNAAFPLAVEGSLCNGGFPCNAGTLGSGQSISIAVVVQTPYLVCPDCHDPFPLFVSATVSSDVPDPNPANNSQTLLTALSPARIASVPVGKWGLFCLILMLGLASWMKLVELQRDVLD